MKRLLCILSGMNAGGAETFLMKLYQNIDRSKNQMDFCINVREKCFYEDEILKLGGKIYRIPSKSEDIKNFKKQLTAIIKENSYESVLRITSSAMGLMDLKIAKKAGVKICCARSSNASDGGGLKAWIAHHLGSFLYKKYVDVKIAPSDLAAIYTFGKRTYCKGEVSIMHNALDVEKFSFSKRSRDIIRNEFGISEDYKIIGHIGRFVSQKNHNFLIDVFKFIHERDSKTKLLLIGDGPLKSSIEQKLTELSLLDCAIFAGIRSDIQNILSAMDVFVFPSLYEGMPNTVIEAQASGLPCVIADTITKEANITGLVSYLPIKGPDVWAEKVLSCTIADRQDTRRQLRDSKYDIESVVEEFTKLCF